MQVVRAFFAALNAFSQATVGHTATDGDLFAAYDAVQHYMKFICMPKLAACHMGTVCHASNHGTQVKLFLPLLLDQASSSSPSLTHQCCWTGACHTLTWCRRQNTMAFSAPHLKQQQHFCVCVCA